MPARSAGRRVLVVDDNHVYRSTLRAILEHGGYAVTETESLAEARAALAPPHFDLVIVDVELGDGNGLDLIPDVRATLPGAPIVVVSGRDAQGLTDRADLVLVKTLDPASLLAKLGELSFPSDGG